MKTMREDPFLAKLIAWVNSCIKTYSRTVQQVADMADGTALLLVLAQQYPNLVQRSKIILWPEDCYEVEHNLRLLTVTLEKVGNPSLVELAEEIGQIGEKPDITRPIIDLALRLYFIFGASDMNLLSARRLSHQGIKVVSSTELTRQVLVKEEKTEITDKDMAQLHSHSSSSSDRSICLPDQKRVIKKQQSQDPAELAQSTLVKVEKIQVTYQDITQMDSQPNFESSVRLPYQTEAKKALKFQSQTIQQVKMENRPTSPCMFVYTQTNNAIIKQKQQIPPYNYRIRINIRLASIIASCLRTHDINIENHRLVDHKTINFKLVAKFFSISIGEKSNISEEMRIKYHAAFLFKSTKILKILLKMGNRTEYLCRVLKCLGNIQKLLSKPMKLQQLFVIQHPNCLALDNQLTQFQTFHSQLFWTEHLRVLIAFEIQYVAKLSTNRKKEEKKYQQSNRCQLRRGFTCFFLKSQMKLYDKEEMTSTIIKSKKYKHLADLFGKKTDKYAFDHQNCEALRNHITTMLQLKHQSIFYAFLKIYNVIVGEIIIINIRDIQYPDDRILIIDDIVTKVRKNGREVENFYRKHYHLRIGASETEKLLKATVYCFLAELNGFPINEMYCDAFKFASKTNQKLQTQKEQQVKLK